MEDRLPVTKERVWVSSMVAGQAAEQKGVCCAKQKKKKKIQK
jgi:hypothetical protein